MSLSNPSWDRPGDARHAIRPQSPTQLDVAGMDADFGAHGISLALPPANAQTWAKTTSGSKQTVTFAGGATTQAYPALTQLYSSQDGTWSDGVVCWLVGANGETLANGNRYGPVTAAGFDGGGVAIYSEDVGGSGGTSLPVRYDDTSGGDSACNDLRFTKFNFTLTDIPHEVLVAPKFAVATGNVSIAGSVTFSPTTLASGGNSAVYPTGTALGDFSLSDPDSLLKLGTVDGNGKNRLTLQNGTLFLAMGSFAFSVPSSPSTVPEEMVAVQLGGLGTGMAWTHNVYGMSSSLIGSLNFGIPTGTLSVGADMGFGVVNSTDKTLTFTGYNFVVIRLL